MKDATMLYRCPGPHRTDGIDYDYTIVDADAVGEKLSEGWFLHYAEAHAALSAEPPQMAIEQEPARKKPGPKPKWV